nr:hypothetical protein [Streptomyces sp. NBC_00285]
MRQSTPSPQGVQLGDWLDPAAPPKDPSCATTDSSFVATAFVAHSAHLLADAARELGHADDADRYAALHRRTADTAWHKWGDHARTTQNGCTLALQFGIVPTAERAAVGEALAALVRANRGRIATGFLRTPFVLPAHTRTGHTDEAYQLLLNPECPGWLYQVERGATTMWERWDAIQPDGTIDVENAGMMLSFNHYAYGAVAAWLSQSVAGLRPATPGDIEAEHRVPGVSLRREHYRFVQGTSDRPQEPAQHVQSHLALEFPKVHVEVDRVGRIGAKDCHYSRYWPDRAAVPGPDRTGGEEQRRHRLQRELRRLDEDVQ